MSTITELFKVSQDESMNVVNAEGISFESLMASLMLSAVYCGLQLILFYYLRSRYPQFYDKYGINKRNAPSNDNIHVSSTFITFCISHLRKKNDIVKYLDIEEYKKFGLDSYLFLRFLYVCLYFFVGISLVCLPILLPINYLTSSKNTYSGFDLISISIPNENGYIIEENTYQCMFYFLATVFIVFWYHYILIHEINFYDMLKLKFNNGFEKSDIGSNYLKIMYIENIDLEKYPTVNDIKEYFESFIPGCVEEVYPVYYSSRLIQLNTRLKRRKIELNRYYNQISRYLEGKISEKPSSWVLYPMPIFNTKYKVSVIGISHKVNKRLYLENEIRRIEGEMVRIKTSSLKIRQENNPKIINNRIFIKFRKVSYNNIMNQIEFKNNPIKREIGITLRDINWEKVMSNNEFEDTLVKVKKIIYFIISVIIIVCWCIPVACVATLSQLDYLIVLIPSMKWVGNIPDILKEFISWVLPTIILSFLTTLAISIIRMISNKKRFITGKLIEKSLQKWVFVFLFFQLFIVITISSGFIAVLQTLVSNPISVPIMISIDFPKASNFFTSFFILRGLTLLGNNTLQLYGFVEMQIVKQFINKRKQKTQREIVEEDFLDRYLNENSYWGQIYPTFSVYGCIGIVYSIISPVILVFCCINFILDLLAYKYTIKYSKNPNNKRESYGELYIPAIKQMYLGIYSLQVFGIGLFIRSVRCRVLGVFLFVVLALTVWTQWRIETVRGSGKWWW